MQKDKNFEDMLEQAFVMFHVTKMNASLAIHKVKILEEF